MNVYITRTFDCVIRGTAARGAYYVWMGFHLSAAEMLEMEIFTIRGMPSIQLNCVQHVGELF